MKKFLLTLGVACMALPSFAATRILYQQNFETAADAAEAGWSFGGTSMSIASDKFGKFLELSLGQSNGRSAQVTWGQDIFLDADGNSVLEDGTYNLSFDFCIKQGSNNQYNSEFTVFTNHAPIANNLYRTPWSQKPEASCWDNYLFDMSQVNAEATMYAIDGPTTVTEGEDGTKTYAVNTTDANTFAAGEWYTVSLAVNVNSREVEYSVLSLAGTTIKEGTRVVPETDINGDGISMYAEGLFLLLARYQTIIDLDNIKISYESAYDFCNAPTVALTRVGKDEDENLNLNMRAYTITFLEGETLHVIGTDGQEVEEDYYSWNGAYTYETTTSGTLKAWTTAGAATSEVVEVAVDCAPIALPAVTATISSVSAGFGKTYTLTVDNSDVPLRPTIAIAYEFTGVSGDKISNGNEEVFSGATVTVSEEGSLKVTSMAYGYQATTVEVKNDVEFETKQVYDFARMTQEELKECGFTTWSVLNSATTSGFNNWSARKRLYYQVEGSEHENEEGAIVYDNAYPFGYIADDNTTNVLNYSVINNVDKGEDAENVKDEIFKGLTIFPKTSKNTNWDDPYDDSDVIHHGTPNIGIFHRVGLFNDQTINNNNNIIVHDLDPTDFVVVNYINDYGTNSIHPICASDEEYYAQLAGADAVYAAQEETTTEGEETVGTGVYSVTYPLYRIDTVVTKISVFKQKGVESGVEGVEAEVEGDNWYYSIDGVRMAEPTRPGIYIHNGKKIIVK